MKTQDEVESEARAEISKKRAELLRVQQELNRKLKHADRQRNKRKKLNGTPTQKGPTLKPLPIFALPFTIKSTSKLLCNYQFKLKTLQENNNLTTQRGKDSDTIISAEFVCRSNLPAQLCPYGPVKTVSHILLRTKSNVYLVQTKSWTVKHWEICPDLSPHIDHVLLFGSEELLLGIDKSNGRIVDLKTSDPVYRCTNSKIETYHSSTDRLYLSVSVNSDTPSYQILTLRYDPTSLTLSELSQFTVPHLIVSLKLTADKLIGTSAGNVYVWSREGEVRGELALPGSDRLICRAARLHDSHTYLAISCGDTLYSLVLSQDLDDQRLIGEIETQGNVFVCGFYCVFSRDGVVYLFNMVTESLCAKVQVSDMKLVDVCLDYPIFLFLSEDSVLLCHIEIPES